MTNNGCMARPSQQIDERLLAAGRALFPTAGCGLAVRAVAEHAGVNPGLLHYHFGSKDDFLRAVLQQMYEEMYASLQGGVGTGGAPLERLRAALRRLAGLLRTHRTVLARVWTDAIAGAPVAREFVQRNMPRHVGLLGALLEEARADGSLRDIPPLSALMLLLGGVGLPMVFVAGLADAGALPPALRRGFDAQVMDDAAVAQRIDLLVDALRAPAGETAR